MPSLRNIIRLFRYKLTNPSDAAEGMYMSGLLAWKSPFLMKAVVDALHIAPDDEILELGIGFGDGVKYSYKQVKEGRGTVYSVDRWKSLFVTVQNRFPKEALENKRIVFNEVPDAKLLPFNNEFFDKIFHVHSSYFWTPDLPLTLMEIMRVLKPGGIFLSGMHLKKLEILEKGKLLRRRQFDPTRYIFELEPVGFRDVKMNYVKGMNNREYQLISAIKPLELIDRRDPDELANFLESRFKKEYVIERGIEEGYSLVEIERELACEKMDEDMKLLENASNKQRSGIADS